MDTSDLSSGTFADGQTWTPPLIGCPDVRRVRQKYERGKCEGIIITLPAKSFGGGVLRLQAAKAGRVTSGAWPLSHNVYYVNFIM